MQADEGQGKGVAVVLLRMPLTMQQCDEEKPDCRRCTKAGRKCPGFPELSVFLSMNDEVAPRRSLATTNTSSLPTSGSRRVQQKSPSSASPLSLRPSVDWDQAAIAYFLQNFVSPVKGDVWGYLKFLPNLLSQHSSVECLRDSLQAVSLVSLANISSMPSLQMRSRQAYGKALASIGVALKRLSHDEHASLLAAIFLLQKFEVRVHITNHPEVDA